MDQRLTVGTWPAGTHILIISDDQVFSMDLEMSLNFNGFRAVVMRSPPADTGHITPAAAIMDVARLDFDTLDALNLLAAQTFPTIAVSALDSEEMAGLPANLMWFSKPVAVDDLLHAAGLGETFGQAAAMTMPPTSRHRR
jgi:DNA-binding response OmpR family regulator